MAWPSELPPGAREVLAGVPLLGDPAGGTATPPWEGAVAGAPGAADVLGSVTIGVGDTAGTATVAAAGLGVGAWRTTTGLGVGAGRSTAGLGVAPGAGPVDMRPEEGNALAGLTPAPGGRSDAPAERVFMGRNLAAVASEQVARAKGERCLCDQL